MDTEINKNEEIKKALSKDMCEVYSLVNTGIPIEEIHLQDRTDALLETIVNDNFIVFKNILKKGIKVNFGNFLYLHHVVRTNKIQYLKELSKLINIEEINRGSKENNDNALHVAIQNNINLNIILELSKLKVNWNHQNKNGQTPLHFLLRYRKNIEEEIVNEIINLNIDFNIKDKMGISPQDILESFKLDKNWLKSESAQYLLNRIGNK